MTANVPDLPDWGTVCCIEASPHDAGTAYLVVDNHRMDDYQPVRLEDDRLRQDVDEDHRRPRRRHALPRDPRGPEEEGAALPRHRARRDVLARRGQDVEAPATEPADRAGPRSGREGRRPRGRHARPVDLDSRRPDAGPRDDRRDPTNKPAHLFPVQPATRWRVELGRADLRLHAVTPPARTRPTARSIWFQLGKDFKGEVKLEILDAKGNVDRQGEPGKVEPRARRRSPTTRTMTTMTTARRSGSWSRSRASTASSGT